MRAGTPVSFGFPRVIIWFHGTQLHVKCSALSVKKLLPPIGKSHPILHLITTCFSRVCTILRYGLNVRQQIHQLLHRSVGANNVRPEHYGRRLTMKVIRVACCLSVLLLSLLAFALHPMRIVELQNVPIWIMHREGILPPRLLAWCTLYRKTYFLQMLI
jgi:hypothetical protein